jgi:hypothetical protein
VRFDRKTRHAFSKSARARSKVAAVPSAFRRMAAGVEPAGPAQGVFLMRHVNAQRADAHVGIIDVPAFLLGIERVGGG